MNPDDYHKLGSFDMVVPLDKLEAAIKGQDTEDDWVSVEVDGFKVEDLARIGKRYWFEYHCWESHQSGDAEVWYRSHQQCVVLSFARIGADGDPCFFSTIQERGEAGHCLTYRVRFDDGLEWTVFEDELMTTRDHFCRPDPPKGKP
jgi:hypothetical protein